MLTKETLDELSKFFEPRQVQWKPQTLNDKNNPTRALATAYVDARDVMNRLDRVVGGGWQFTWDLMPGGEVRGILTIHGVTRSDVGERGSPPLGDTLKAAVSDAFKRTAVHFGVGRYLYYLPAQWVAYDAQRKRLAETPQLPSWAIPGNEPKIASEAGPAQAAEEEAVVEQPERHDPPATRAITKPKQAPPAETRAAATSPAEAFAAAMQNPGDVMILAGKQEKHWHELEYFRAKFYGRLSEMGLNHDDVLKLYNRYSGEEPLTSMSQMPLGADALLGLVSYLVGVAAAE